MDGFAEAETLELNLKEELNLPPGDLGGQRRTEGGRDEVKLKLKLKGVSLMK